MELPTYAYSPGMGPLRRRKTFGNTVLEYLVYIVIIAIIVVYAMPYVIAPMVFGVTAEEYAANLFLWNILAAAIALPVAWFTAKIVAKSIRNG